jgi:hypothetical protein
MNKENSTQNNEIDLYKLFQSFWHFLVRVFQTILNIILFLFVFGLRRILWLIILGMLAGAIGLLVYSSTDRYYTSEMIVQPNGFTSMDMAQYINDIHVMCIKGDVRGIAKSFDISEESAGQIRNIQAFHFIDVNGDGIGDHVDYKLKFDPVDTTRSIIMNRILIKAEVFDITTFEEVTAGLKYYIDKNPYLITVNQIRKNELNRLIVQAEEEIETLDSLQDFEYYSRMEDEDLSREGQILFLNEKQTQLYYRDKVSLMNQILRHQKQLELSTDPITIIKDFSELQIEENPLIRYILYFGFFGGLTGYFLLLLIYHRKPIYKYLSAKG